MKQTANFAIIVAAGKGVRMGANVRKQYLKLGQMPILARTVMAFDECSTILEIYLVIPKEDMDYCQKHILAPFAFKKKIHLVEGGHERQASVLNGLKKISRRDDLQEETIVLIHDGVRPFADQTLISDCIQSAMAHGSGIPAVKIIDTVKKVRDDSVIEKTVERDCLYAVQTPQTFKLSLILNAFEHAEKDGFTGTDDASILEHSGEKVFITKGSRLNIKITEPEDLIFAEYMIAQT
jgi:2-C-methyl-D-erythritol 4-phosphate cytidylyltransferase